MNPQCTKKDPRRPASRPGDRQRRDGEASGAAALEWRRQAFRAEAAGAACDSRLAEGVAPHGADIRRLRRPHDHEQPAAAFSEEAAATPYAQGQTNLEKQRHRTLR
jgi:hypothetical protein